MLDIKDVAVGIVFVCGAIIVGVIILVPWVIGIIEIVRRLIQ